MKQPPTILQVHRELKYRVDAAEATRVERLVEANLPLRPRFSGERDAVIRGVYLDFADRSMTARSLATPRDSQKVRYRHYEKPMKIRMTVEHDVFVWIEVKVRLGDVVTKERVPYEGIFVSQLLSRERPAPPDATALTALLDRGPLEPVAGVHYRRMAFEDPNNDLRVTIDREIAFQRPSAPGYPGPDIQSFEGCIIEAKSRTALPRWLEDALGGAVPSDVSKFEVAIRALEGLDG